MSKKSQSPSIHISKRLYRLLLGLYPAEFHCEYGPFMAQVFADQCREATCQRGLRGLAGLWLHTYLDLLVTVPKEHLMVWQEGRKLRMNVTAFDRQLAASVNLWIKALRCGYSVKQSFEMLAQQAPEPTASAFRQVIEDLQNGAPIDEAIACLQERVPSQYLGMVMAVTMKQRQEGGNLADKLDVVNRTIKEQVGGGDWSEGLLEREE